MMMTGRCSRLGKLGDQRQDDRRYTRRMFSRKQVAESSPVTNTPSSALYAVHYDNSMVVGTPSLPEFVRAATMLPPSPHGPAISIALPRFCRASGMRMSARQLREPLALLPLRRKLRVLRHGGLSDVKPRCPKSTRRSDCTTTGGSKLVCYEESLALRRQCSSRLQAAVKTRLSCRSDNFRVGRLPAGSPLGVHSAFSSM